MYLIFSAHLEKMFLLSGKLIRINIFDYIFKVILYEETFNIHNYISNERILLI